MMAAQLFNQFLDTISPFSKMIGLLFDFSD